LREPRGIIPVLSMEGALRSRKASLVRILVLPIRRKGKKKRCKKRKD